MSCAQCKCDLPEYGALLLNYDGDFVCGLKCFSEYSDEKRKFFDMVDKDDPKKVEKYIRGE